MAQPRGMRREGDDGSPAGGGGTWCMVSVFFPFSFFMFLKYVPMQTLYTLYFLIYVYIKFIYHIQLCIDIYFLYFNF